MTNQSILHFGSWNIWLLSSRFKGIDHCTNLIFIVKAIKSVHFGRFNMQILPKLGKVLISLVPLDF